MDNTHCDEELLLEGPKMDANKINPIIQEDNVQSIPLMLIKIKITSIRDMKAKNNSQNKSKGEVEQEKELYDAFGEASDDEDADEETGLRPGRMEERSPNVGLTYHAGFLDDDAPSTAGGPPTSRYKDEPDLPPREPLPERSHSPDRDSHGSGSGDGSWEHASETR